MVSTLHPKRKPRDGIDEYGRSPLINAVCDKDFEIAEQALANGADINLQDDGGYSALFFAVQDKDVEISTYLLEHGANPNLADRFNNTPLMRALNETNCNPDDDAEILELLLAHGAEILPVVKKFANEYVNGEIIRGGTTSPKLSAVIEHIANFKL